MNTVAADTNMANTYTNTVMPAQPQFILLQVTLGTNYFGPFFLTHLLMERLRASAPSRLVWVVSSLEVVGDIHWDDLK